MASLILEQDGKRRGGMLRGRVVIGRRPNSHICIPDRTVSRIHAWIGQTEGAYFVVDTGSRAGTHVNGRQITAPTTLGDGDRIRVGPVEITFRSETDLPPGVEELDLSDRKLESGDGIFVDCSCGAPLWAPWDFGGRVGQCRYCGKMISLPKPKLRPAKADASSETVYGGTPAIRDDPEPAAARVAVARRTTSPVGASFFDRPAASSATAPVAAMRVTQSQTICGACQTPISVLEETTRCPDCGVAFHADCWKENFGCSSYGCRQVGALAKLLHEPQFPPELPGPHPERADGRRRSAWEELLLPGSLILGPVGALIFGVPSMVLLLWIGWTWPNLRSTHLRRNVTIAAVVSLVASLGGAWLSWYWWLAPVRLAGGGGG